MKKRSSKTNRFLDFFAGRGFYIVLFLCVAAIGLSGYALFFGDRGQTEGDAPDYLAELGIESGGNIDWDIPGRQAGWLDSSDEVSPSASGEQGQPGAELDGDAQAVAGLNIAPPSLQPPPTDEPPASTPEPTPKPAPAVYIWPVSGSVITRFAKDELVYSKTMGDWRTHLGIDIETAPSSKVAAIRDGTVEDIYEDPMMGTTVVITHEGDVRSVYSNLSKVPTVSKGDSVKTGDIIGAVGGTAVGECAETNHLHLEIFNGDQTVDPLSILPKR